MQPQNDRVISLRDGRTLGYAEYGDPGGKPVFFFHGLPGSRRQRHPDDSIAIEFGARIIAIDRPGYGLSDFQQGRKLLDWPDDVAQLADSLRIDRFVAIGLSGGGPYLLACAYKMPERITSATVISGMGPIDDPDAVKSMLPSMRLGLGIAPKVPWEFVRVVLLATPWGFRLEDIHKKIFLWHGEEDTTVPLHMGRYVARSLSDCKSTFYPGEGHTLIYNYWREILAAAVT
jgi:pimeloyl-ACP methyl ester carboxylesterase